MTKSEKQIIIDKIEEYAQCYGYYWEESENSQGDTKEVAIISKKEILSNLACIKELAKSLGINSNDKVNEFIAKGRKQYRENYGLQ